MAERGLPWTISAVFFVRHFWGEQWDEAEPQRSIISHPNEMRELPGRVDLSGELDRMARGSVGGSRRDVATADAALIRG